MNNEVKLNPEHHDNHLKGGDGEDQVQHCPEHPGDHLHPEKGRDKVQHNIQNTMVITYM